MIRTSMLASVVVVVLAWTEPAMAEAPYATAWARQTGAGSYSRSYGVTVDGADNAYISGFTEGSLGGPNAGRRDAFVTKYSPSGAVLWCRQIGTSGYDYGTGVAVDTTGNAYISGYTEGSLGGPIAGNGDAFLTKFEVPEPSTLALLAAAGLGLTGRAWRRRKRAETGYRSWLGGFPVCVVRRVLRAGHAAVGNSNSE